MSKYSFLNQWFTFTYSNDKSDNLIYSCTNNHYINEWMEKHGYTEFKNTLSTVDLDLFIHDLNESSNMVEDFFDDYFPEISNYTLMDKSSNWSDIGEYRFYSKEQMKLLFNKIWEVSQDSNNETTVGFLTYHNYYSH
jgi:hypothetical protein